MGVFLKARVDNQHKNSFIKEGSVTTLFFQERKIVMKIISEKKKIKLRNKLILAANRYHDYLMSKDFMIICDNGKIVYVSFSAKRFKHLTGITSSLDEEKFFEECWKGILATNDISSKQYYNGDTIRKKLNSLCNIDKFLHCETTNTLVLSQLKTNTRTYKIAIYNINKKICICFNELNIGWSLRTSANTDLCNDVNKIAAIFSKNKTEIKYDNIVYISNIKKLYSNIPNLSDKFSDTLQERLSYII